MNEVRGLVTPNKCRVKRYGARLDEPFRQQLFIIYTVSAHTNVDGYTACALPCLNDKRLAAKNVSKGYYALILIIFIKQKNH